MDKCKHHWSYDHTVYQGPKDENDSKVAVHRQCSLYGIHQMATTKHWQQPFMGYDLPNLFPERE